MQTPLEQLVARLRVVTGLDDARARGVVAEVLDAFDVGIDAFIARRHLELRREGLSNDMIYARIREEACQWRFCASDLTERQIRRRIYGG